MPNETLTKESSQPLEAGSVCSHKSSLRTACRWARFFGFIVDFLILMVIIKLLTFVLGILGFLSDDPGIVPTMAVGIFGVAIFLAANAYSLSKKSQTIGKKLLRTKIVTIDDKPPTFFHLAKRYGAYLLASQLPFFLGFAYLFINALYIYRPGKRCIHDLAGQTKVVFLK